MLHFLRRIRRSLINSGSMKKYTLYAIGEIALVVIGILIALQVSEWNTNRKRQQQETQILEDLHEEFLENRTQLDTTIKYHSKVRNGSKKIIALFPIDPNTVNLDSLMIYHRELLHRFTYNPQQTIINSLTSTSSFDIISNRELRKLLQRWSELLNDYQEDEFKYIRFLENQFFPYMIKHFAVGNTYKDSRVDLEQLKSLEYENTIKFFSISMKSILNSEEFSQMNSSIDRIIELTSQQGHD